MLSFSYCFAFTLCERFVEVYIDRFFVGFLLHCTFAEVYMLTKVHFALPSMGFVEVHIDWIYLVLILHLLKVICRKKKFFVDWIHSLKFIC